MSEPLPVYQVCSRREIRCRHTDDALVALETAQDGDVLLLVHPLANIYEVARVESRAAALGLSVTVRVDR